MSERREGEEMTAFTIRRIRNEIIEECARTVELEAVSNSSEHPDDVAYNLAIKHAAEAVRNRADK